MNAHSRPGEQHGSAKLTEDAVRFIRREARRGRPHLETLLILSDRFGIDVRSEATISQAATGVTWGHVPGALRAKTPRESARRPRRRA